VTLAASVAVLLALALDRLVGEVPGRVHPVALFGRLVTVFDRAWLAPRMAGAGIAVALPLLAAGVVGGVVAVGRRAAVGVSPRAGTVAAAVATGLVLFTTTSLGLLVDEARAVVAASESDVEAARKRLPALAGRDPSALSAGHLRSAAVESAAENLADGLVAPLLAFAVLAALAARLPEPIAAGVDPAVLAVAVGVAGAAWVKAVNTMDSMLGYRSKPVGWAPARLDDAVMWLPARASAVLLAAACLAPGSLASARRWVDDVPSPNSGWPMGTVAAALGVRLVKPGVYELGGNAALPTATDAERAVRRVGLAGVLAYLVVGVMTWG